MSSIVLDVRYAIRSLVLRPGYALLTIGVLALAIACNTTVFAALNAFLLRPLPYADGERIVMVFNSFPKMGLATGGSSIPDYLERRAQAPSLADLAIVTPASRALTGGATAEQLSAVRASASLFNVLGVPAALGRVFTEEEATLGNERVVVLSDALWRTRFGARESLIGSDIELDGEPHRVVGVMPASFGFPDRNIDAWLPFAFTPEQTTDRERGNDFSITVGRLTAGATLDELNAELDAIAQRQVELHPGGSAFVEATGFTGRAQPLREYIVGDVERMLYLLQGFVLAVLLIACANVSSLQLARVIARRKEIAVRSSLGADRMRIARLVLVEMWVLIGAGAVAGLLLAQDGIGLLRSLGLDESSQGIDIMLDGRVVLFNVGVAGLAALIAGLAPLISLRSRHGSTASALAAALGGNDRPAQALSNALVVVQIALCFALLVGAGLLTKSFYRMQAEGPGFGADGLLTARVALPQARYPDSAAQARFFDLLLPKLTGLSGVTAVGYTSALPFGGEGLGATVSIDGYEAPPGAPPPGALLQSINHGYLPALGIPVVRGRNFMASEPERVAIVDEIFADLYWPDGEPLGQRVQAGRGGAWHTVVGVVGAVKVSSLAQRSDDGTIYWHYTQQPSTGGFVALRTALTPEAVAQAAAREVASVDPDVPLFDSLTMNARIADSLGEQRAPLTLIAVFAAVAFVLSMAGIYGVLAWIVTRRTGEIGVRMALGARPPEVLRMVLKHSGKLVAVGLGGGIACALALGRFLASEIYDVSVTDPFVFASALVGLSVAAFLASWLPARHAARLDPWVALRCD